MPRWLSLALVLALALLGAGPTTPKAATAQAACVTFPETGKQVCDPFLGYWQAHGGLALNGFPLSPERDEQLENGQTYRVQWFERVRMEYHPENAGTPYEVLLGQFGRIIHPADPPVGSQPGMRFYPETGHNVPPDFAAFWDANGGLPQFGYPLSEVITETLEDGKQYQVQYFERARFERHPENAPPYNILLGQFGRRILSSLPAGDREQATVTQVVDGDTIKVQLASGQIETVRYIGVDTPETVEPGTPVQCYGPEATARNKQLVEGKTVELEKDQTDRDRYGRLLRYVWAGGAHVGEALVREGYARSVAYPPDTKYQATLNAAQAEAQQAGRGLWSACQAAPSPSASPSAAPPSPSPSPAANCDPSYPTVCIPPPPPDLDCGDIPYRNFPVLPPDPHKFDGDKDGVGCES